MNNNKGQQKKLSIIPLGGLGEIGKNMTAFVYGNDMILVDAGLAFPDDDMLGIDLVIPDTTFLMENKEKFKAIFLTHGHEDHIGALPYVMKDFDVPVYGTPLTLGILSGRLKENGVSDSKCKMVKPGATVRAGAFRVEFIRVNHSIPDAVALAIHTPVGVIVHTGDYKFDQTPVDGQVTDYAKLSEVGRKGVLLLMSDSTNIERTGYTPSEKSVGKTLDEQFRMARNRVIVATFSSNVHRIQQVIDAAVMTRRKVAVIGRSMVNVVNISIEMGYLKVPQGVLIDIDECRNYAPRQIAIITTGSQGEPMSALTRMSNSDHRKVSIMPGDTVIISATPIPGNEKGVARTIDNLYKQGAEVIYGREQGIHVSGHASQEEIKLIYSLVRPKYAIPVHGEYRHLTAQKHVVEDLGIPKENIFILASGNVLELDANSAAVTGSVHTGAIFVDGLGVGDVGNIVLRDRQHLSEDGIMIVVMTLERHSNVVLAGPDIVSRGFVYVRESEDLMEDAKEVVENALDSCLERNITDWGKIKNTVKDALSDFLWKRTKRSPMILPIIMEA